MQIVKEKLEIEEELEKKINILLKFNNIKEKLEQSIISLKISRVSRVININ